MNAMPALGALRATAPASHRSVRFCALPRALSDAQKVGVPMIPARSIFRWQEEHILIPDMRMSFNQG
jgi:hypothetical protein